MNRCLFVPEHNLYVVSLVAERGTAKMEIYSFRQTGLIADSFVLKSGETSERGSEMVKR